MVQPQQTNALRVREEVAHRIELALDRAGIEIPYPRSIVLLPDQSGSRADDRRESGLRIGNQQMRSESNGSPCP
jgi:hypothetical protein